MNLSNSRKLFEQLFHFGCVVAAIGTTLWCVILFFENNDVCLVDFKKYNEEPEYISPSFSIGFANPFNQSMLEMYGKGINTSSYIQFLQGQYWDKRMLNINYDEVTIDINKYFLGYEVVLSNLTKYFLKFHEIHKSNGFKLPYVSFRHPKMKVFGFDPPNIEGIGIAKLGVMIKTEIFQDGIRPNDMKYNELDPHFGGLIFLLHYPGQVSRSWSQGIGKWAWPKRSNASSKHFEMSFTRRNMDVIVRRNKYNKRCNEDWKNYDTIVLEHRIREAGCRPPYYYSSNFPICSTLENMKKVAPLTPDMINNFDPPCRSISKLQFDYQDVDYDYDEDGMDVPQFTLSTTSLDTTFKLIELVRAYDAQSLIGNAGGYIGIFLGYTICQLPAVMINVWAWIQKHFRVFSKKTSIQNGNESQMFQIARKNYKLKEIKDQNYDKIMKEIETLKEKMKRIESMMCE